MCFSLGKKAVEPVFLRLSLFDFLLLQVLVTISQQLKEKFLMLNTVSIFIRTKKADLRIRHSQDQSRLYRLLRKSYKRKAWKSH